MNSFIRGVTSQIVLSFYIKFTKKQSFTNLNNIKSWNVQTVLSSENLTTNLCSFYGIMEILNKTNIIINKIKNILVVQKKEGSQ